MKKIKAIILVAAVLSAAVFASACGGGQETQTTQAQAAAEETAAAPAAEDPAEGSSYENSVAAPTEYSFGSFTTMDLDGNEVTEAIFAEKDYTMVNFWGTYCGPCIQEMPDLQELNEMLPDNMQMVGMVCDLFYENPDETVITNAKSILDSAGSDYINLMTWDGGVRLISSFSGFVPTTFFVNSEGTIVGDPIIGAQIDVYKDRIVALSK